VPLTRRTDTGDPHSATAGWEAIYPSKRMEAYREGVEDYLYLYLLGQLADKAQASGLAGEAQQARALRQQAIDAVVADRGKYETIRHYRERLGEMIESLAGKVGGSAPQSATPTHFAPECHILTVPRTLTTYTWTQPNGMLRRLRAFIQDAEYSGARRANPSRG
jgi:hypothetical protein